MEVQVLGDVRIIDEGRVIDVGPKERVVLARLVGARGRVVRDDALVDVLWGDRPPATARKTLQGYVHRLRRVMGSDSISRVGSGYSLSQSIEVDIDLVELELANARQSAAEGRLEDAADLFERARRRFRGEPLRELEDDPDMAGIRRQLVELELACEDERLANEIGRGRHGDVIGELEALVGRDPTRERSWCLLVSALADSGRRADALNAVARARRALVLELGIQPGPQLRRLERAVLEVRTEQVPGGRDGTGRGDGPPHEASRDLDEVARPARLPRWDTRFCGRTDELAWLVERVPATRLVVLTGPGGIGKTRLAAAAAERLSHGFRAGVHFVALAGIVEESVDDVIAERVGVRREPDRTPLESCCAWLGDRDALLVLDNCEEVVAAARRAVAGLLGSCSGLHLLVTSRVPLGMPGEVRVPVPPLSSEPALALLVDRLASSHLGYDSERAADDLLELCRRTDGVPLALEMAAAQCRTMSPRELLDRLARHPDFLTDRAGLFADRHRDLDALIAWSFDQLTAAARCVAARMSVVIGGFSLDAAETVAGGDGLDELDVVRALQELHDAGLIVREEHDGAVRHRLLEPIRQHAAQTLDHLARTSAEGRHAEWFRTVAVTVGRHSTGPDFKHWADVVERDLANFRQAHRRFLDLGDAASAVDIIDGLAVVGTECGLMELADWCDATMALVRGRGDDVEVTALAAAVRYWYLQNRREMVAEAATRGRSIGGRPEHLLMLEMQATQAELDPQRWDRAIARLEAALEQFGSDVPTWASTRAVLQLVLLGGRPDSDAVPMVMQLESPVLAAMLTFHRAVPYYMREDDMTAAGLAGQAVDQARAAGAVVLLATQLMGYGGWQARLPESSNAAVFEPLLESLELWDRLRIPWGRVTVTEEIAQALAIRGRPESAFVLWGAVDESGIEAPSKVGRHFRTRRAIAHVTDEQAAIWRRRGASMTLDQVIRHARDILTTDLGLRSAGARTAMVRADRLVATVVFSDIVGSTATATAVGDRAWRAQLDEHDRSAARLVVHHRGHVVKSLGDGLLARFETPRDALVFALALRDRLRSIGLTSRIGVHTGEIELLDNGDILGSAVNLAARVEHAAEPGSILVSSTVRDLMLGGDFHFLDRGERNLKGFESPWHLFALVGTNRDVRDR